jgi:hypothetical protein
MSASKLKPIGLPKRSGVRPKTILGPLHLQYSGHGDPKYLHQLIKDVLAWPDIDVDSLSTEPANLVCFRLKENAVTDESSAFLSPREFARIHFSATIDLGALGDRGGLRRTALSALIRIDARGCGRRVHSEKRGRVSNLLSTVF